MADQWIEASSLADILSARDAMLACSLGTDIDHNDISEEMPEHAEAEIGELEQLWFDYCASRLTGIFAKGSATLYRAIAVPDIDEFLAKTKAGAPLGCCWTWDKDCATTDLHGGEWQPHDLLLTAEVKPDAVEWGTTFQQHFAHPCEREVRLHGEVLLTGITMLDSGEALPWQAIQLAV